MRVSTTGSFKAIGELVASGSHDRLIKLGERRAGSHEKKRELMRVRAVRRDGSEGEGGGRDGKARGGEGGDGSEGR